MLAWKVFYFSYMFVLPIAISGYAWCWLVLGFIMMHFIAGVLLTAVFQVAHVMESNEFPVPTEEGMVEQNWLIHQLETTVNFAPNAKVLGWFVGGLNYQVEHHLFPNICHIHYPNIAKIVEGTAKEYGVVYQCNPTFRSALKKHVDMLRYLGNVA
jgi:linoleoyl-CoA desaturase